MRGARAKLSGLIGRPGVGRATRHEMIVFVNARPVDSRTLNYALIESYHESLPKGRYPLAFVFFECDPAAVDVNVHPAKREVRFRSEVAVRGFVIRAVLQRLRELGVPAGGEVKSEARVPNPGVTTTTTAAPQESRMASPFRSFSAVVGVVRSPGFSRNFPEPPEGGTTSKTIAPALASAPGNHSPFTPAPYAPAWRF